MMLFNEAPDNSNFQDRRKNHPPMRRSSDRVMLHAGAFLSSLELIGNGVILLNSRSQITFISQSAQPQLAKLSEFVIISENRLNFTTASNQKLLAAALEKISEPDKPASISEVLLIDLPGLSLPLILSLFKLPAFPSDLDSVPHLMLIFRDPVMEQTPQWQVFSNYFGLTALESRLCLALADGLSINEYSATFHLSPHTARTHLKSVFNKTATRRQSDLLRLIFAFTRL